MKREGSVCKDLIYCFLSKISRPYLSVEGLTEVMNNKILFSYSIFYSAVSQNHENPFDSLPTCFKSVYSNLDFASPHFRYMYCNPKRKTYFVLQTKFCYFKKELSFIGLGRTHHHRSQIWTDIRLQVDIQRWMVMDPSH